MRTTTADAFDLAVAMSGTMAKPLALMTLDRASRSGEPSHFNTAVHETLQIVDLRSRTNISGLKRDNPQVGRPATPGLQDFGFRADETFILQFLLQVCLCKGRGQPPYNNLTQTFIFQREGMEQDVLILQVPLDGSEVGDGLSLEAERPGGAGNR
jgi:hypothetical protein